MIRLLNKHEVPSPMKSAGEAWSFDEQDHGTINYNIGGGSSN